MPKTRASPTLRSVVVTEKTNALGRYVTSGIACANHLFLPASVAEPSRSLRVESVCLKFHRLPILLALPGFHHPRHLLNPIRQHRATVCTSRAMVHNRSEAAKAAHGVSRRGHRQHVSTGARANTRAPAVPPLQHNGPDIEQDSSEGRTQSPDTRESGVLQLNEFYCRRHVPTYTNR